MSISGMVLTDGVNDDDDDNDNDESLYLCHTWSS